MKLRVEHLTNWENSITGKKAVYLCRKKTSWQFYLSSKAKADRDLPGIYKKQKQDAAVTRAYQ